MKQDFEGLRKKLEEISFPDLYLFKFIVKSDVKKIAQIEALFNSDNAQINRKESSNTDSLFCICINSLQQIILISANNHDWRHAQLIYKNILNKR